MYLHPAVQEALSMLQARFPGQTELSLDDYAAYRGIKRRSASTTFKKLGIPYIKHGREYIIQMKDYAIYLAKNKMVDGKPLFPTEEEIAQSIKRRRGFCQRSGLKQLSG